MDVVKRNHGINPRCKIGTYLQFIASKQVPVERVQFLLGGCFGHQIRNILCCWDVLQLDVAISTPLSDEVLLYIDVFRLLMVDWVLGQIERALVVPVDQNRLVVFFIRTDLGWLVRDASEILE